MDTVTLQHDEKYLGGDDTVQRFYFKGQLSVHERAVFWDDCRDWFAHKGYTLYAFRDGIPARNTIFHHSFTLVACLESPDQLPEADPSPYAHVSGTTVSGSRKFEARTDVRTTVSYLTCHYDQYLPYHLVQGVFRSKFPTPSRCHKIRRRGFATVKHPDVPTEPTYCEP